MFGFNPRKFNLDSQTKHYRCSTGCETQVRGSLVETEQTPTPSTPHHPTPNLDVHSGKVVPDGVETDSCALQWVWQLMQLPWPPAGGRAGGAPRPVRLFCWVYPMFGPTSGRGNYVMTRISTFNYQMILRGLALSLYTNTHTHTHTHTHTSTRTHSHR